MAIDCSFSYKKPISLIPTFSSITGGAGDQGEPVDPDSPGRERLLNGSSGSGGATGGALDLR